MSDDPNADRMLKLAATIMGRKGGKGMTEKKLIALKANSKRPRPNAKGKKKPRKPKAPTD